MLGGGLALHVIELLLAALAFTVALALLARKSNVPLPVFLVVGGLGWGLARPFIPGAPSFHIPPDVVYAGFLPPLILSAAYAMPVRFFRLNLRAIGSLAVGLVLATMCAVAFVVHALEPSLPLAAAFALGAIVAPPDPVAATAIGSRLGLPNWMTTILEGEGLVNDASALTAYQLALLAVTAGSLTFVDASVTLVRSGAVGIGVGLAIGWLATRILRAIDDPVLEVLITLLLPYVVFLGAEGLRGSGVLSAVTAGFLLRIRVHEIGGARTRLSARAVWDTLVFAINGIVFMLIGFSLGDMVSKGIEPSALVTAALVSAVAIVVRLAWMFVVPFLLRVLSPHIRESAPLPSWRQLTVFGWSGMRGVVSLVVALSVPVTLAGGRPFPGRDLIILVTFAVIFSTLVLQGLTLPWVIRVLGVSEPEAEERAEEAARAQSARAALARLDELNQKGRIPREFLRDLRVPFERRLERATIDEERTRSFRRLRGEALAAERKVVDRLWNEGKIGDNTSDVLEREIDVQDIEPGDPSGPSPH